MTGSGPAGGWRIAPDILCPCFATGHMQTHDKGHILPCLFLRIFLRGEEDGEPSIAPEIAELQYLHGVAVSPEPHHQHL